MEIRRPNDRRGDGKGGATHGRVVFEIGRFNDYELDVGEQRKQGPRKGNY